MQGYICFFSIRCIFSCRILITKHENHLFTLQTNISHVSDCALRSLIVVKYYTKCRYVLLAVIKFYYVATNKQIKKAEGEKVYPFL